MNKKLFRPIHSSNVVFHYDDNDSLVIILAMMIITIR